MRKRCSSVLRHRQPVTPHDPPPYAPLCMQAACACYHRCHDHPSTNAGVWRRATRQRSVHCLAHSGPLPALHAVSFDFRHRALPCTDSCIYVFRTRLYDACLAPLRMAMWRNVKAAVAYLCGSGRRHVHGLAERERIRYDTAGVGVSSLLRTAFFMRILRASGATLDPGLWPCNIACDCC